MLTLAFAGCRRSNPVTGTAPDNQLSAPESATDETACIAFNHQVAAVHGPSRIVAGIASNDNPSPMQAIADEVDVVIARYQDKGVVRSITMLKGKQFSQGYPTVTQRQRQLPYLGVAHGVQPFWQDAS